MLAAVEETMKGSYSYNNENEYVFFIDDKLTGHITPVDAVIARVSFRQRSVVDFTLHNISKANYVPGAEIPVPVDFTLHNISEGQRVPLLLNGFLITWTSKYELKRGPDTILALHVQRQQGVQSKMDYLIVKPAADSQSYSKSQSQMRALNSERLTSSAWEAGAVPTPASAP